MRAIFPSRRPWDRWLLVVLAAVALLAQASPHAAAEGIVLFTASVDYTGGTTTMATEPTASAIRTTRTNQNPNLPAISNGVMLSPGSGGLSNTAVGPLGWDDVRSARLQ